LSAAHELVERGFKVTVFEARDVFGGKARSMPKPRSGTDGRADLPAEHGFRFFPGFYRHLPDTMARIPHENRTVAYHLVSATRILMAQAGGPNELVAPAEALGSIDDLGLATRFMWEFGTRLSIKPPDLSVFFERLLALLCSCDERRYDEFEQMSWWEYTGADHRSPGFQKFLATGLTRTLVAAQAKQISARTGGLILCQLLFDMMRAGGRADRVLDAPTSEVWIDPWIAYLSSRGVVLRGGYKVAGIDCDGRRITGVTVQGAAGPERVVADHYVAALPAEKLALLLSQDLLAAEPRLAPVPRLTVRWMNGMMFYLRHDVPLVPGHAIFIDSEWALTAISQAQFWPDVNLTQRGDGSVAGILSVDISDWNTPGLNGKVAMECTEEEIREEVWRQLIDHINDGSLEVANVVTSFLDPDIQFPNPTKVTNLEPLLINTAGSWADRPEAVTRIPNFFLAADFVRTYTDLATMEGANEAARRAVNGILDATGSDALRCPIWKLREPAVLAPFRMLDRLLWRLGLPVLPPVRVNPAGELEPTDPVARGLVKAARWLR